FAGIVLLVPVACAGATGEDVLGFPSDSDQTSPFASAAAEPKAKPPVKLEHGGGSKEVDTHAEEPPPPACPPEVEGNDTKEKATPFTSCIRGTLSGPNDKDFFRIVAPKTAGRMLIDHKEQNGRVQYHVTEENGAPVTGLNVTFTDLGPDIEVEPLKAYF